MLVLLLCCSDFSVSQVTDTTTNPPVKAVCTGALTATVTVKTVYTSMRLAGVLGQNEVGLPPPLTDGYSEGCTGFAVLQ